MNVRAIPIGEFTSQQVAEALTRSFEGYFLPFSFTAEAYERRFRGEHVDAFASRLYFLDDELKGIILISRRGWTSRVAAMGIVSEARGRGFGTQIMQTAVRDAENRRDTTIGLEVIEQNTAATALYTRVGFRPVRRLVGYTWKGSETYTENSDTISEIDPSVVARTVATEGDDNLPWLLRAETLAAQTRPTRGFCIEERVYVLVTDGPNESVKLLSLIVPRRFRRQGWGTRMIRGIRAQFRGLTITISPVVPEELVPGFFEKLRFQRFDLTQLEMCVNFSAKADSPGSG